MWSELLSPQVFARFLMVLLHVLAFAMAAAAVAIGHLALLRGSRIDTTLLRAASQAVVLALVVLWASGLALLFIDTGMQAAALAAAPKLLAKLLVVSLLSLNGLALHRLAFPRFGQAHHDALLAATLPTLLGAVSTVSWLYAAFLGVARPLAPLLGFAGFIALYLAALGLAMLWAMLRVRPLLAARLRSCGPAAAAAAPNTAPSGTQIALE